MSRNEGLSCPGDCGTGRNGCSAEPKGRYGKSRDVLTGSIARGCLGLIQRQHGLRMPGGQDLRKVIGLFGFRSS